MQKFIHILTEKEKFIIENHFIFNKENSLKNFKMFCEKTIGYYSGEKFMNNSIKSDLKNYSIELIWDKNTRQTAMMHCFGHKDFEYSNNKLKYFNYFNGDLNAINNEGRTALMYLSIGNKNNLYRLKEIINDPKGFDLKLRDNRNNNVHYYILVNFNIEIFKNINFNTEQFRLNPDGNIVRLITKVDFFKEMLSNVENNVPNLNHSKTMKIYKKSQEITQELKNLSFHSEKFGNKNITDYINDKIRIIDRVALKLKLDLVLTEDIVEPQKKRPKI
jgi:hypothetical protein